MSKVRFANGTLNDFLNKIEAQHQARLAETWETTDQPEWKRPVYGCTDISISAETTAAVQKMLNPGDTARYSGMDPESMMHDAMGRLTELPAVNHPVKTESRPGGRCEDGSFTPAVVGHDCHDCRGACPTKCSVCRAIQLCNMEQWGGAQLARFTIDGDPNHDIVIAQGRQGVTAFVRSYLQRRPGNCFKCNNAEDRGYKVSTHKCYRRFTHDAWMPDLYVNCLTLEIAEDVANEIRSAYSAEADTEVEGHDGGKINWSARVELPFSPTFVAEKLVTEQDLWNSVSGSEGTIED